MFERFTERARQVIVLAQDEARALRHNYIGTEHLLLGLLREEEGLAARILESVDITVEEARMLVARIVGTGDEAALGQIPFTPRAKRALENALREAVALGHNYIGTEHLLLGLVRERDGIGVRVLLDLDADPERIRMLVLESMSGAPLEAHPYVPSSPPVAGEVADELARLRSERANAVAAQDFDRAVSLGARERSLVRAARAFERAWSAREDVPALGHAVVTADASGTAPAADDALVTPEPSRTLLLIVGWLLFAVALATGIVLGWLIWR